MPKIENANSPKFDIPGVSFHAVASPSRGSQETSLWRAHLAPNTEGTVHHMTREEIILAVKGDGAVTIAGERHTLRPGDVFAVPAFTEFKLESAGNEPFEAVVVLPVGGHAVIPGQPSFQPPWSV